MKILDKKSNIYTYNANDRLGEGAQGAVYRTDDGDVAIKIDNSEDSKEKFNEKMQRLIYKPLPNYLNIVKPLVLLDKEIKQDNIESEIKGYVMRLLDNYEPLNNITGSGAKIDNFTESNMPEFLQNIFKENKILACKIAHYCHSGGLRKRLYILRQVAYILSGLHLNGMVYCDLSPNNIFISDDENSLVNLIDADNIEYADSIKSAIYTPNYEVPEIDRGSKNSFYSDIYAFATLSFYLLTMIYPFKELESWDSEATESKHKWENPWIEDSLDSSCATNEGLRGELSTKPLEHLFRQTFEEGKLNPYKRPIMPLWIKQIENALNDTLKCPKCKMSYYDSYFESCPYCDAKKPLRIIIESSKAKLFAREIEAGKIFVPLNVFKDTNLDFINEMLFSIVKEKENLIIKKENIDININNKSLYANHKRKVSEFKQVVEIKIDSKILKLRVENEI